MDVVEINSYVRGYHAYKEKWNPSLRDVLLLVREPHIISDKFTVATFKNGEVVGHVPYNLAPAFSQFLKREFNKAVAETMGEWEIKSTEAQATKWKYRASTAYMDPRLTWTDSNSPHRLAFLPFEFLCTLVNLVVMGGRNVWDCSVWDSIDRSLSGVRR